MCSRRYGGGCGGQSGRVCCGRWNEVQVPADKGTSPLSDLDELKER